jgi:hypothetical protein
MTWAATLRDIGVGGLFAGAFGWLGLFLVAAWRGPGGADILSFSLKRQWAANIRFFRGAADLAARTGLGRLLRFLLVGGTGCLILAGAVALVGQFPS